MNERSVPVQLRRLWRLPSAPARLGRRSTLDTDSVVSAAVRLADEGGLEAAALPRVAGELEVTAMSLYRHVGSKDELLQLMVDAASEPPSPSIGEPWQDGLRRWAMDMWELFRRRPWIPHVPVRQVPSGPNQITWIERGLAHLATTPLSWGEKLGALTVLSSQVRQAALLSEELAAGRPAAQEQSQAEQESTRALRELVTAERLPQTSRLLDSDALADSGDPSETSARQDALTGVDLVLGGLARRMDDHGEDADHWREAGH